MSGYPAPYGYPPPPPYGYPPPQQPIIISSGGGGLGASPQELGRGFAQGAIGEISSTVGVSPGAAKAAGGAAKAGKILGGIFILAIVIVLIVGVFTFLKDPLAKLFGQGKPRTLGDPLVCPSGWTLAGLICYKNYPPLECRGAELFCYPSCVGDARFVDLPLTCDKVPIPRDTANLVCVPPRSENEASLCYFTPAGAVPVTLPNNVSTTVPFDCTATNCTAGCPGGDQFYLESPGFCAKKSEPTNVVPRVCAPGQFQFGLLCYDDCPAGFNMEIAGTCSGSCPAGYNPSTPFSCFRPALDVSKMCNCSGVTCQPGWAGQLCCSGVTDPDRCHRVLPLFEDCGSSGCDAGFNDTGCTCSRPADTIGRPTVDRVSRGGPSICQAPNVEFQGSCVSPCTPGFEHSTIFNCLAACPTNVQLPPPQQACCNENPIPPGCTGCTGVNFIVQPQYVDIGVSCAKPSYDRGVGISILDPGVGGCDPGFVREGSICYRVCPNGYSSIPAGVQCMPNCPGGFEQTDPAITFCSKPATPREVKGITEIGECPGGQVRDGLLCYQPCPSDFPVPCGPTCFKKNPIICGGTG